MSQTADTDLLLRAWRGVCYAVRIDRRAVSLQRLGKLGTYAECGGQEIVPAAVGAAMAPDDVLLPAYRESAALALRGVPVLSILAYWGGDLRGLDWPGSIDWPWCVPIGTNLAHAVGVAWTLAREGRGRVAVACTGDGGVNRGEFHEGLNFAAIHRLPLVYVVNDNGWAISTPRERHSARSVASRAEGEGARSFVLDASDPCRVVRGVVSALDAARREGPVVVVVRTRRTTPHTTTDDPRRYRDPDDLRRDREWNIPERMRAQLLEHGIAAEVLDRIDAEVAKEVAEAAEAWLAMPPMDPEEAFGPLIDVVEDTEAPA